MAGLRLALDIVGVGWNFIPRLFATRHRGDELLINRRRQRGFQRDWRVAARWRSVYWRVLLWLGRSCGLGLRQFIGLDAFRRRFSGRRQWLSLRGIRFAFFFFFFLLDWLALPGDGLRIGQA